MKVVRNIVVTLIALAAVSVNALGNSLVAAAPGKAEFQRLRWKGRTIKIDISNSLTRPNTNIKYGSDVLGAIQRSIRAWESAADVQIVTELSDKQNVSPSGVSGDGVSLITIAQTPDNVLFFSKDSDTASAKTRIFYNRVGSITEADIVLNPFQQFSTDGTFGTFDLEATLTHEIGHLLGLHHSTVLGATMADSFARMGTFGIADLSPRTLGESDIAAIRDLYGPTTETAGCCSTVTGKLTGFKAGRSLHVWAEEDRTGRVMAQAEVAGDGVFSLGGLAAGTYSLFWKISDDGVGAIGQLGPVTLEANEIKTLNEKITVQPDAVVPEYIGLNSQIADLAVPLTGGLAYNIYLGGKDLDAASTAIEFNSPYFSVAPGTIVKQDFDRPVSVISFVVTVHPNTPPGQYSIFLAGDSGLKACLIGSLSVE